MATTTESSKPPALIAASTDVIGSGLSSGLPHKAIFVSNDLIQYVTYGIAETDLTVHSRERAPSDVAPNDLSSSAFSTSYQIKKIVSSGQSHEFYVNGRARNGDDIIEHWEISKSDGSNFASRAGAPIPFGMPAPPHSISTGILGGVYSHPTDRASPTAAIRTELYRGSALGTFLGIAADPDGRFLMIIAGGKLYQLVVAESMQSPVEIPTDFPEMSRASIVNIREFANTSLRAITITAVLSAEGPTLRCIAPDADRDGLFEFPGVIFDDGSYTTAGFLEDDAWTNFVEFY